MTQPSQTTVTPVTPVKEADWGLRTQIITSHIRSQIQQGQWQPGQKLPSARKLAESYGVCIETVRNALRELNGQGLVRTVARSGTVVSQRAASNVPTAARDVAYVRLLDLEQISDHYSTNDDILPTLERPLLEQGLHLSLVTQRPTDPDRAALMAHRLQKMIPLLAGVILQRPPADLLEAILPLLARHGVPHLVVGKRRHDEVTNFVQPDYIGMGQVFGRYLAAIGARRILLPGLSLAHACSGIQRCQGIVAGYLQMDRPMPELIPLTCPDTSERASHAQVAQWLAQAGHAPDAVVAHGDRMAMGAMSACLAHGLRVPQDVVVIGTSGLAQATRCTPTLTTADQQQPLLARTAVEMLAGMIQGQQAVCPGRYTPVRFHFRQSAPLSPEARLALADVLDAGLVSVDA